jgi:glycosyltransferase involved in cell wall biosynthesis
MVTAAGAMIAMTETEKAFYAQRGLPPDRIHVLGAGVAPSEVVGGDGAAFRLAHGLQLPLVAFVSTLTYDKGAEHLVQAVLRLWAAGQPVDLVLAGAVLAPFQAFLDRLPVADRRRLNVLGPISEAEKRDLLAAADILAMPSRTDSFGITYLEAWANGKPVIAANAWGMRDVVADGKDGLLVPFGDPVSLAGAIGQLINDPARRAALGENGQRKVLRQYTWDRVYARAHALYADLAGARVAAG